jgi:hypothetical protein
VTRAPVAYEVHTCQAGAPPVGRGRAVGVAVAVGVTRGRTVGRTVGRAVAVTVGVGVGLGLAVYRMRYKAPSARAR